MSILLVRHNSNGTHEVIIYCLDGKEDSTITSYKFTESGILIHCDVAVHSKHYVEERIEFDIKNGFFQPVKR